MAPYPAASADGLKKTPVRSILPDFWGPMDPIGVQKSDSSKGERVGWNPLLTEEGIKGWWTVEGVRATGLMEV